MKVAFIFLAVFFVAVAKDFHRSADDDDAFQEYKTKYKKKYKDKQEELERKMMFIKCRELVKKHNEDYSKGLVSYSVKENFFCDKYKHERDTYSKGNREPIYDFIKYEVHGKSVGIINNTQFPAGPASVNWFTKVPQCVTRVKDQGFYCNNCWAFSAVSALEFHTCLKTGKAVTLSEQQLVDCNKNEQTGNWGCKGGSQASAYMYIYGNDGIESDATYVYKEDVEHEGVYPCSYNRSNRVAFNKGYFRLRPRNETLLRDVIAAVGPVSAALYGSLETFYFYADGIYDDPACPIGTTHSVIIYGYGTENGIDYWLCKNSWSVDWGNKGYFKIRRGVNRCGITVYLIYPDVYGP